MKTLILILILISNSSSYPERKDVIPETSLNQVIIDEVLTKHRKNQPILFYTTNSNESADYIVKFRPPLLWQLIQSTFDVTDTAQVRKLLANSLFMDKVAFAKSGNIRFANRDYEKGGSSGILPRKGGESVIDCFYLLSNNDRNKCVIYVHWIDEGSEVALLEKKNGLWKVTSLQTETLE
jgi:hypothetical protein